MLKKYILVSVLALALVVGVGVYSANAALTLDALTIASDGALTLSSSSNTSAVTLGTATQTTGVTAIYGGTATGVGTAAGLSLTPGTAGTLVLGNAAGTGAISLGTSTGAQTVNIGTGASGIKTIHIGDGATANVITIGSSTGAATTNILAGSGGVVVTGVLTATSPVFVTPALGTPASGVATNLTGLPLTTGVTGVLPTANGGTGIAFFTAAGPTAARVYTFPDAAATIARTDAGQTFTGNQTFGAYVLKSVNAALTALAGGAQAGTALTKDINFVTVVATIGDSVQLPVAVAGMDITIVNKAANSLNVFGQTGDAINAGAANAAYAVATLTEVRCISVLSGATTWECQKSSR